MIMNNIDYGLAVAASLVLWGTVGLLAKRLINYPWKDDRQ